MGVRAGKELEHPGSTNLPKWESLSRQHPHRESDREPTHCRAACFQHGLSACYKVFPHLKLASALLGCPPTGPQSAFGIILDKPTSLPEDKLHLFEHSLLVLEDQFRLTYFPPLPQILPSWLDVPRLGSCHCQSGSLRSLICKIKRLDWVVLKSFNIHSSLKVQKSSGRQIGNTKGA